jgi:hypothetical protein
LCSAPPESSAPGPSAAPVIENGRTSQKLRSRAGNARGQRAGDPDARSRLASTRVAGGRDLAGRGTGDRRLLLSITVSDLAAALQVLQPLQRPVATKTCCTGDPQAGHIRIDA